MAKAITKPLHLIKATGAVEIKANEDLPLSARRLFDHLRAHAYPRMKEIWDKAQKAGDLARLQSKEASESSSEQERAVSKAMRAILSEGQEHAIPLVSIRRYAAEARDGYEEDSNARLKAAVSGLQRVLVQFDYLQSDGTQWQSTQLLGPSRIANGVLHYSFQLPLMEKLIEPALYSYISLRVVYQCDSKYTLILYQVLKRYADRNAAEPYWQIGVPSCAICWAAPISSRTGRISARRLWCRNEGVVGFRLFPQLQAIWQDTGIPRPVMMLMTLQATLASVFCVGRIRAWRPRPMTFL